MLAKDEYLARSTFLILRDCCLPFSTLYLYNIYSDQKLLALEVPSFIINILFHSKLIECNLKIFNL
jgi:hypothetical protein